MSRRAQGENACREHQPWVSNSVSLSFVSLRTLSIHRIQMVATCAIHRRKEGNCDGRELDFPRGQTHMSSLTQQERGSPSLLVCELIVTSVQQGSTVKLQIPPILTWVSECALNLGKRAGCSRIALASNCGPLRMLPCPSLYSCRHR